MIFDSKRRQSSEAEAETTAPAVVAPGDLPPAYLEDEPVIARTAADVRTDSRLTEGAFEAHAERAVEQEGIGRDHPADKAKAQRSDRVDELEPLFAADVAESFRHGWDAVQIGFVDDPRQAVKEADALVQQVLHNLTQTFSGERSRVEAEGVPADATSTEELRVALRRYRAFLQRLLSL